MIGDESGQVRDEQAQGRDAEAFYDAVVQGDLFIHSRFGPGLAPGRYFKLFWESKVWLLADEPSSSRVSDGSQDPVVRCSVV